MAHEEMATPSVSLLASPAGSPLATISGNSANLKIKRKQRKF